MNKESEAGAIIANRSFLLKTGPFLVRISKSFLTLFTKKKTFVDIICALLIILFIYTGVNKLWDYDNFKLQMGRSPFIQNWNAFIATTFPTGEILLALLLVVPKSRLLGLYLSYVLMALFTGYIWLMLNYAPDLPCSCGGVLAEMSWKDHLYFNAGYSVLAMAGIFLQANILQTKRQLSNN